MYHSHSDNLQKSCDNGHIFYNIHKAIYNAVSYWYIVWKGLNIFQNLNRYVWAGLIVLAGIALNTYSKNRTKVDAHVIGIWQKLITRTDTHRTLQQVWLIIHHNESKFNIWGVAN